MASNDGVHGDNPVLSLADVRDMVRQMLAENREHAAAGDQTVAMTVASPMAAQADAAKPIEMEPDREADVGATGDPTERVWSNSKHAWVNDYLMWQRAYAAQPTCCQEFSVFQIISHHCND